MILVDSPIWIGHLRSTDAELIALLNRAQVAMHPFVRGELACGNLKQRTEVLTLLKDLPRLNVATDDEVMFFIEQHGLIGAGIGFIDAHLFAASMLETGTRIWTRDKKLRAIADTLALAYDKQYAGNF